MRARADKIDGILHLIQELADDEFEDLCSRGAKILSRHAHDNSGAEVGVVKAHRRSEMPQCPHCSGGLVRPKGFYRGRRRYRCLTCRRKFNELTGSPITGTHYPEKWRAYMECMVSGLSVAKTARKVGVTVPTAFAWRHKLLKKYEKVADTRLQGIVEADETFFLFSEKGNRQVSQHRKPRKRGGKAAKAGVSDEQVPVIAGCDRDGNVILGVAGRGRISMSDIDKVISSYIAPDATLCTDAHRSFKAYAKQYKFHYVGLNISQGRRVIKSKYHIQNVNGFHSRLKGWMARFNGVSTKYLQNYMNWFALLEETKTDSTGQERAFMKRSVPSAV